MCGEAHAGHDGEGLGGNEETSEEMNMDMHLTPASPLPAVSVWTPVPSSAQWRQ